MRNNYFKLSILGIFISGYFGFAQVGINTTTPNAMLEVKSTSQLNPTNTDGLLIPTMDVFPSINPTAAQNGMLIYLSSIYLSNSPGFYYWDNSISNWVPLGNKPAWSLTGNSGTNSMVNFLGTTDNRDIVFKRNNIRSGLIGSTNTVLGYLSLNPNPVNTGSNNVSIGVNNMIVNTTGSQNIAIGNENLMNNTTGNNNVSVGDASLSKNTTGSDNAGSGYGTLYNNTTGSNNTAVGKEALRDNTSGNFNTAVGCYAGYSNNAASRNTSVGYGALQDTNLGMDNTAVGYLSSNNNISGAYNTSIGSSSLQSNLSGRYNTAVGFESLYSNRSNFNTATGAYSLYSNTNGTGNTAMGYLSMDGNTSGSGNTAMGYSSLDVNTGGVGNTAVGYDSLGSNTTGISNTAIGHSAGLNMNSNRSNTINIGYGVGWATTTSNQVNIGNLSQTTIGGQVNWSTYSDQRIKKDIQNDVPGIIFIKKLNPVTYKLDIKKQSEILNNGQIDNTPEYLEKYDIEQITMSGFLAQEVAKAAEECNYNFSGVEIPKDENGLYKLKYSEFVVPLVKAVQEQQLIIDDLLEKVKLLERKICEN